PDGERPEGIAPAAPLSPPQRPESSQYAGDQEGQGHDQDRPGELADRQPVMQGGGDGGQQQEGGEANRKQIREPVDAAEQVGKPLAQRQAKPMWGKGQQLPPLAAQDLDPAERPSESLLLQPVEAQWHQAFAPNGRFVDAGRTQAEQAQARLGIFRDDVLVPPPNPLQRGPADQSHRSGEDDGVAVGAAGHRYIEEIAVAIEEAAEIATVPPIAIVLRRL